MPRPRKPTKVLEFTGRFAKNPSRGRERADEPEPGGPIGEPPAGMPAEVEACWREIVSLCPAGVLADCDTFAVECAAHLAAQVRAGGADPATFAQLRLALGELGMSPSSRSKVRATVPVDGGQAATPDPAIAPTSFAAV